jgi:membrane protease YdiL (CAAX protease family)
VGRGGEGEAGRTRRLAEVAVFVAVWMAIGELMDASQSVARQETYLLLGIPLTAAFQLGVARRGIRELWVRGEPGVRRRRLTVMVASLLAVYPVVSTIKAIADTNPASIVLASAAAVVGAGAAGYAFGLFERVTWRQLALCVALGAGWGIAIQALIGVDEFFSHHLVIRPDKDFLIALSSLALYLPTTFVIEEVTFRGALDSHAFHPGDSHGVLVAIFVSVLWTCWHAPIFGWKAIPVGLVLMGPMGVVLSIFWRRSGNLAVTGTAHAISDSVRNGMLGGAP